MGAAAIRVTEKKDEQQGIDEQDIFDGVISCLATITCLLCNMVLGADEAPFRPVMGIRGAAGVATGAPPTVAASAAETPRRWARALRERAGASPRARRAASSTGRRTWIH